MDYYMELKQNIKDDLFKESMLDNFYDLIEIQIELMSWYRHGYCAMKNGSITHDEATNLGCTIKNVVRNISYSLYHNEMITIEDIIKLFDENIEMYENTSID